MRRGDLVTVAMPGDFGKPRPALVIQSDLFDATGTVAVLLLSGTPGVSPLFRITIQPTPDNGLHKASEVMVDKIMSVKREKIGPAFGRLADDHMLTITRSLAVFLGIA